MLEDLDLVWYEEPVLADDLRAWRRWRASIKIPVATGENHYTRYEFKRAVRAQGRALSHARRVPRQRLQRDAEDRPPRRRPRRAVSPHVVHEISLQVCGALPNGFLVEYMDWAPPDLFDDLPEVRGRLVPHARAPRPRPDADPGRAQEVQGRLSRRRRWLYGLSRQSRSAITPTARSTASAASRIMSSRKRRPTIWTPTGWPSFSFAGTMAAGRPMKFMA